VTGRLTPDQVRVLLRPLHPSRVAVLQGMSHLEAWDVRAHLTRIFGFGGWDEVDAGSGTVLLFEAPSADGKRWSVGYRATRRLVVRDPEGELVATYEATAVGGGPNQPSRADAHDMAIKTAESQALKRCAINLGSQFGLSLYDNGKTDDVVRGTLVGMPRPEAPAADLPEVADAPPAGVDPETGEMTEPTPEPEPLPEPAPRRARARVYPAPAN